MRRLRIARGLTQEAAAERAGLVTRHLQKTEAAEVNVTLHTLVRLALALNVEVVALFQGREGDETVEERRTGTTKSANGRIAACAIGQRYRIDTGSGRRCYKEFMTVHPRTTAPGRYGRHALP